ncbi:hypothetical protein K2Z83_22915 [Oscillochloris sp. ZM17-4]|uniref:NB-ARC domain-containing protein n=1 Tax=Oscillochloris sp. ZM17-4 TaxID=2866714 RepID=UPI001C730EB9|nr:NB-ARC domain-containing protein [Oscillochloris sp. ZM17-4]MBX0330511.1 hypothetical protein [Oscillochloris sp. ZM17-4]
MSVNRSETFGRLLKAGLNSIGTIEGKAGPTVDSEVGAEVSMAGTTLQRYRSGALPSDDKLTRTLARACVTRGLMGKRWLEQFLKAARFPHYEGLALTAELFPETAAPTRAAMPRPNIPPPTYRRFIMRRAAYDAALAGLGSAIPLTIVVSMGGMGKSSLAQAVARDCTEGRAPIAFTTPVWVSDRDRPGSTSLSTALDEIARVLGYPGVSALNSSEKRRAIEDLLRSQPALVVLDNAETVADSALLEWLAALPTPSKALVTSRAMPPVGMPHCLVELKPMEDSEARALISEELSQAMPGQRPGDAAQLTALIAATGGNPQAIKLALGLVRLQSLPDVLEGLRAGRDQPLFDDMFTRSWGLLDGAAQLVVMAITLFPTSVDATALGYVADLPDATARRGLGRLAELSLLEIEQGSWDATRRYALHPLVRAFVSAQLTAHPAQEQSLRGRWIAWCAALAGQVGFCWQDLDRLDLLDADHLSIQAGLEWAAAHGEDAATVALAEGVRYYYNVRGLWDERRMANYGLRAGAARRLGDRSELVLALAQQAEVLSKKSTLADAASLLAEAEAAAAGADLSSDAAFELGHARGLLAHARGDLAAAEAHWRGMLPFAATLDAQKHVINRRWLATCLLEQGRVDEAAPLYRESLDDARAANDTRSVTGNSLKLATIDLERGDLAAAEAALAECHTAASRHNDQRRLAEWALLSGRLRLTQGDHDAATPLLEQAVDLFTRMGMRRDADAAQQALA